MSKPILSLAERLTQLRNIPPNMIPTTLKHKIMLPKFTEIKLQSNQSAKQMGPIFVFYRKYIADLRYHNPNLKIIREVTQSGPLIARLNIKKSESMEPIIIEGSKFRSPQELKNKLLELHNSEQ